MNRKYQWDFRMEKICVQVSGFRDLVTSVRERMRADMLVSIVVYSIQTGVVVIAYGKSHPFEISNY